MAVPSTMRASPSEHEMTTDEFVAWFDRLGLSEAELARHLETSQPTVNRWRKGERKPPPYLWRALAHLLAELEAERTQPNRRLPHGDDEDERRADGVDRPEKRVSQGVPPPREVRGSPPRYGRTTGTISFGARLVSQAMPSRSRSSWFGSVGSARSTA